MKKLLSALLLFAGCTNSGVVLRFEQRTQAGVTSLTVAEYVIPVVSVGTGPSLSLWQTRNADGRIEFEGRAALTNRTSACGLYESEEAKSMAFRGVSEICPTNGLPVKRKTP